MNLVDTFSEFKEGKNTDRPTMVRVLEDVFRTLIKKKYGTDDHFDVIVNTQKGDLELWRVRDIVPDGEVTDDMAQISISEATGIEPDYEIGEECYEQLFLVDGKCGPEPCEVGVPQYNRLLNIMPTVGSECYTPRLNKNALTDGKYQPLANGRFVDGGYYHSCKTSRPETAAVALKTPTRIQTVRLWRRCDCCAAQNAGTFVQAKNVKTGNWEACGGIVSAEEGNCLGNDPAKEFVERDCGGMMASDVRLYKEGSDYMVAMELEAYSC